MKTTREYLFRGFTGNKWRYGSLINYKSDELSILSEPFDYYGSEATQIYRRCNVIPETVGQYTGLTDKNGTKIFEGDLVVYLDNELGSQPNEIIFRGGSFHARCTITNDYGDVYGFAFEVMGNIHQNKELIKK